MTLKNLADMIELLAGRGGTVKDAINRNLIEDLIGLKLAEVFSKDGTVATFSGATVVDQYEYDLPRGIEPVVVILDDEKVDRIGYTEALELRYEEA